MARFRCKPCPGRERMRSPATVAAIIPAGECGGKDQVSRARTHPRTTKKEDPQAWI